MVMMTTCPPPKVKKRRQGWSHHICALYDHRWHTRNKKVMEKRSYIKKVLILPLSAGILLKTL
ncbi:MAG: hypothetical protein ACTSO2_09745 [Promethearchaeota archaeon]